MTASRPVFLKAEERYDVWVVKAAERPHLLSIFTEDDEEPPFLSDACDIPGWRSHGISGTSRYAQIMLRVGPGSTLLRRETQLPIVRIDSNGLGFLTDLACNVLCESSRHPAQRRIHRISYRSEECRQLNPWFVTGNTPVLITECMNDWKSADSFRFHNLLDQYGDIQWRFSDTHAETMTLNAYSRYCSSLEGQLDDSPLAVYDSQFGSDERKALLDCYSVPGCFKHDIFDVLTKEDERPPYRWILMGPARSGTGLHVDPAGTHAWVTLIEGQKRWILFPPNETTVEMQDPQIPSSIWFRDHYAREMAKPCHSSVVELVQYPGETVFVPAGWPHAVLNIGDGMNVALTHNYATNRPQFWEALANEEPEMAERLENALKGSRKDRVF